MTIDRERQFVARLCDAMSTANPFAGSEAIAIDEDGRHSLDNWPASHQMSGGSIDGIEDFSVVPLSEQAEVVTYRLDLSKPDNAFLSYSCSTVWYRQDESWLVLVHQQSPAR